MPLSEDNYFTEMCSGSEAGAYLKLIDFVYHSTLGLRVIKNKKKGWCHLTQVVLVQWAHAAAATACAFRV